MARKKENRENGSARRRQIHNKSKKTTENNEQEDVDIIQSQLATLGLTLREVPGDGNCLFRALGDQLDGHMGNHFRHRQDVTNYMLEHREDFQPFVEDDVPFEKHVSQLTQPGTYAGNDAIVAFARLHQVTIVIHQPNAPLWQIRGWEMDTGTKSNNKNKKNHSHCQSFGELHIAYHGGDHYDSVRRKGDTSHLPANIHLEVDNTQAGSLASKNTDYGKLDIDSLTHYDSEEDIQNPSELERQAMSRSGCTDLLLIRQLLENNCYNLDAAVEDLIAIGTSFPDSQKSNSHIRTRKGGFNRKQHDRLKKQERKRASEERKKCTVTTASAVLDDSVITHKIQCLNI